MIAIGKRNRGQSFFLALLAAVAAWHKLVLLTFRLIALTSGRNPKRLWPGGR